MLCNYKLFFSEDISEDISPSFSFTFTTLTEKGRELQIIMKDPLPEVHA